MLRACLRMHAGCDRAFPVRPGLRPSWPLRCPETCGECDPLRAVLARQDVFPNRLQAELY